MSFAQYPALVALIGVVVGAILQSLLLRRLESHKFVRDHRRAAYQDFLSALASLGRCKAGTEDYDAAISKLSEARCSVALFGSKNVVQLAANLFETGGALSEIMNQYRMYQIILEMRRDSVGHKDRGIKVDLHSLAAGSLKGDLNQ